MSPHEIIQLCQIAIIIQHLEEVAQVEEAQV
jgi:hypothetical protein